MFADSLHRSRIPPAWGEGGKGLGEGCRYGFMRSQVSSDRPEEWNAFFVLLVRHRRAEKSRQLIGAVVGTKRDLEIRRQVQTSVGVDWARGQGLDFCEVSAVRTPIF